MPASSAKNWIEKLEMIPHPEGGFFKETYRCGESVHQDHLPKRFTGQRHFSTGIFYLLTNGQYSKLHRIKSDEMWHFYDGSTLIIYEIDEKGNLIENKLGLNYDAGELPQILIRAGRWFGAKLKNPDTFCLAGCTVSPGFHFEDFEMGYHDELLKLYPQHKDIIDILT